MVLAIELLPLLLYTVDIYINKKRRNATKPGFQRFNQVLI